MNKINSEMVAAAREAQRQVLDEAIARAEAQHAEVLQRDVPAATGARWVGTPPGTAELTGKSGALTVVCSACNATGYVERHVEGAYSLVKHERHALCAGSGRLPSLEGLAHLRAQRELLFPTPKPDATDGAIESHNADIDAQLARRREQERIEGEKLARSERLAQLLDGADPAVLERALGVTKQARR